MDQIKPDQFNTYLTYYREVVAQLAVVRDKYHRIDIETGSPDELTQLHNVYNFLLQERNYVANSLCCCLLEHDGDIRSPLTPEIRARRPDARASGF